MDRRKRFLVLVTSVWSLSQAPQAFPQDLTSSSVAREVLETGALTLSEAVHRTLANSPTLSASGWEVQSMDGRIRQASLWPNPEISLEAEEFGIQRDWGLRDADITLGIRQRFPVGRRVARRVEFEQAGKEVARSEHQVTVQEVLADVHAAFIRAVAASQRLELARQELEMGKEVLSAITARVEGGDIPPADVFRAETDLQRVEIDLADAVTAEETARMSLASFWGGAPSEVRRVVGELLVSDGTLVLPEDPTTIDSAHLDVADKQVAQAKQRTRLEKALGVPDLSAGLGFRGIHGFDESALIISVSMPLPVIDRNQGAVDEAIALARQMEYRAKAQRASWRRALAFADAQLRNSKSQYWSITRVLLPSARRSHEAVEAGFREGKFNTLDLLESSRRLVEVRRLEIEAAERFNLARVRVAYIAGDQNTLSMRNNHDDE